MKHLLALASCIVFAVFNGQAQGVKGIVTDAETGEPLIGATISTQSGGGVAADLDGLFTLKLDAGTYEITVAYVGYESMVEKVTITDKMIELSFRLQSKVLDEVLIVADVAKSRETPIAYSNISSKKIQEELGAKDLPMVLNTTPGAYATEQGGGSGDARVTIRGFDQRNVAVLVDGVPVNDMENGQVYWSNWDGLGDITRTMQVQRGLGASKLAIASVGGTINILTKGIDQKRNLSIRQ